MKAVIDENRVLTLVTNERIQLKHNTKIIIEGTDLTHATPALVTRGGLLYVTIESGDNCKSRDVLKDLITRVKLFRPTRSRSSRSS